MTVRLDTFDNRWFARGRSAWIEAVWLAVQAALVSSRLPGSAHRRWLLRLFGARIGTGVTIKPGVRVKFPWKLVVGDHTWLGEEVWIDNLERVEIGANCCLSQGAYLCTGSHDWNVSGFDLITRPIEIGDCAWIAAKSMVAPGVTIGEGAVLAMGSAATQDLEAWTIYQGVPAHAIRLRTKSGSHAGTKC